mmetsp:Transcript_31905/g.45928  ORF Transcript_31905/g.45928 Transcript_31905/m.45928 type:complete len:322 (-) Transcript_31905:119-1084(-)
MITYILSPVLAYVFYVYSPLNYLGFSDIKSKFSLLSLSFNFSYSRFLISMVALYLLTCLDCIRLSKYDGFVWKSFQQLRFWKLIVRKYFDGNVVLEEPLVHEQLYIFCSFPHGAATAGHLLTMTNSCEMLSTHYTGERRDLAASILFYIPFMRELVLLLGCVDASSATAKYNLKKNRSILIYVGGEREQLMTEKGTHKIFVKNRKGFVKLALQYGAHIVPMYTFGENDLYYTSNFMLGFRMWLQRNFQVALPLVWGRFGLLPLKVRLRTEIGKPIAVARKDSISDKDVEELHGVFVDEMARLFNRSKSKYKEYENAQLEVY